jgi:hypothetical protein
VHTQNVEAINNVIKSEIKSRRGIKVDVRKMFLNEFVWCWNNRLCLFEEILKLVKV